MDHLVLTVIAKDQPGVGERLPTALDADSGGLRGSRPGEARHATFQPVAAVVSHALGEPLDQPGLILGDDR